MSVDVGNLAAFLLTGTRGGTGWTALNPSLHREIAEFTQCKNDGPVWVAIDVILNGAFRGGFFIEYGDSNLQPTWASLIEKLKRAGDLGASANVRRVRRAMSSDSPEEFVQSVKKQLPGVKAMFHNVAKEAYKYYHMYGMVPLGVKKKSRRSLRRDYEDSDVTYHIFVPDPMDGHFVFRWISEAEIEIGWKWNRKKHDLVYPHANHGPDKRIFVYHWPGTRPLVRCSQPFVSTIQRLRADWFRREDEWLNHDRAAYNTANPRLMLQRQGGTTSIETMPASDQWNDYLNEGDLGRSFQHATDSRVDASFNERVERQLRETQSRFKPDYRPSLSDEGVVVQRDMNVGDDLRVITLPAGATSGKYPDAKPTGMVPAIDDWWLSKVSSNMRVPMDILTGKQSPARTSRGTEMTTTIMDDTIRAARELIRMAIETAWPRLFRDMENALADRGYAYLDEEENLERQAVVDYLKYLISITPNDPDIPKDATLERLDEYANQDRPTDGEGREEDANRTGPMGAIENTRSSESSIRSLERIVFAEEERLRKVESLSHIILGRAHNLGVPLNPERVREEVTDVVYLWETGQAMRNFRRKRMDSIQSTEYPMRIVFPEPVHISTNELAAAADRGWISDDVARLVSLMKWELPVDTPKGESPTQKAIRLAKAKATMAANLTPSPVPSNDTGDKPIPAPKMPTDSGPAPTSGGTNPTSKKGKKSANGHDEAGQPASSKKRGANESKKAKAKKKAKTDKESDSAKNRRRSSTKT